jgi:hypothetical protein
VWLLIFREDCGNEKCRLNHPRVRGGDGKGKGRLVDPVDERVQESQEEDEDEEEEAEEEEESESSDYESEEEEEEFCDPVRF